MSPVLPSLLPDPPLNLSSASYLALRHLLGFVSPDLPSATLLTSRLSLKFCSSKLGSSFHNIALWGAREKPATRYPRHDLDLSCGT